MAMQVKEVLAKSPIPELTLQEILDNYSHITLTDDEITEAMIWAKRKKEENIRLENIRKAEVFNREQSTRLFDLDVIRTFMINRANEIFNGQFVLDEKNESFFELMCLYFSNNPNFEVMADQMGVKNPSLRKGLLIPGNFGVGKTWMMKLFAKNSRQVYFVRNAKQIANEYVESKDKQIPAQYLEPFKNPINDASVFRQPMSGLCIDDIGTEDVKNNFGNKSNVIGDLIELRYSYRELGQDGVTPVLLVGTMLHGTTNLTAQQLADFYGERVVSRMREVFNFVSLGGSDRRK